jgi:hypothetical protein
VLLVALLYTASTALYAHLGVRFEAQTLSLAMQFIDTRLLEQRLLESIWFYHANPPMLNLLAGVGLKLCGEHAPTFYNVLFHLMGVVTAFAVHALTKQLSASRVAAGLVTALLVFSPAFVLYENWFFYSFPAMTLLTCSALALYRFLETRSTPWCIGFFTLLAALLLTRSLFHVSWMVLIAVLLALVLREHRRQVLIALAGPLMVVMLWYGKNYYYFGSFGASTWMGFGLSNISTLLVSPRELEPLVARGELSRWALVSRYDPRALIFFADLVPPTGISVLDEKAKTNNTANWNYRDIPAIDRYYTHDAVAVARRFPSIYAHGLYMANRLYFSPTGMNEYLGSRNRAAVQPMERIFNPLLSLTGASSSRMEQPYLGVRDRYALEVNTSVPLIIAWLATFAFGYAQARQVIVTGTSANGARGLVMGFITITAAYLYVVSTALEMGENYRYRFLIEPLFFVLAATALTSGIRALRAGRVRKGAARVAVGAVSEPN